MTIHPMARVALAVAASVMLTGAVACVQGESETAAEETPESDALARVEELDERLAELEADLASERAAVSKSKDRLAALARRLKKSLAKLRASLTDARASAEAAAGDAAAASARIGDVASDLSVLLERYNFHLRRYHGGG